MANNTTSCTITVRICNDDIAGSIAAIKALIATLAESLNAPPVAVLDK